MSKVSAGPRTIGDLVATVQTALNDSSARQAQDIVAALLDKPRFWPAQHESLEAGDPLIDSAMAAVQRILDGAPFAYAVRRAAFRHLSLYVDERVLIPRPETEVLIDEILRLTGGGVGTAVDIGTGSGAIALALASEGAFSRVIATDVSIDALAVARQNASALAGALKSEIEFRHGSLVAPIRDVEADLIVSNPPYIAYGEAADLPDNVRNWEPSLALFSGDEGMAATAAIVGDAAPILKSGGVLAFEVDVRRAVKVAALLETDERYDAVEIRLDLTGRERFVHARRK